MNRRSAFLLIIGLGLIAGTGAAINWWRTHQRLGAPGIKTTPVPGSVVVRIDLPDKVLDYTSEALPPAEIVTNMLPKDTSFAQRRYIAPDHFGLVGNIVLMGTDRTSIHKPEFCLPGQGWRIDAKSVENIAIGGAQPYQLTVSKWILTRPQDGLRGIYVFWFVADNELTTSHWQRVWWLARDLCLRGILQRWAYVSYFTGCQPGQEDAVFERMKQLICASVPAFQVPPQDAARAPQAPAR